MQVSQTSKKQAMLAKEPQYSGQFVTWKYTVGPERQMLLRVFRFNLGEDPRLDEVQRELAVLVKQRREQVSRLVASPPK